MHVISIGYGRHLFTAHNPERKRQEACAAAVASLSMIIFTSRSDNFEITKGTAGLTLYPTQATANIFQIYAAYRLAANLIKTLPREQVVVTTQDPFEAGFVGWLLAKRFRVRLVVQLHADFYSTNHWKNQAPLNYIRYHLGVCILNQATSIRVVSERIKISLESLGVSAGRIIKMPVAIPVEQYQTAMPNPVVRELVGSEAFTYISVGRFVPEKNYRLLIDSFLAAHAIVPTLRLLLVGDGPLRDELMTYAKQNDTQNAIVFLPWSDDVPGLLKASDAYVLSSNHEGWGRVLIEALGAGLPIVTTNVGGANEVVKNNEHGLVVPVGDEEALMQAMVRLADDRTFYQHCKETIAALDSSSLPGANLTEYGTQWAATLTI